MESVSLCMIVKNEQDTLPNCLNSVRLLVDEIVIVDTGSTDKTREVALQYTDKVHDFTWCDDFSVARNYAFSLATKTYILWLDADDIITMENAKKFLALKARLDGKIKQVVARYAVAFDEFGKETLAYNRERLFLAKENYQWLGAIHEVIPICNDAIIDTFTVTHHKMHPTQKGRNLKIFNKMLTNGALDTRNQFYYARELMYNDFYEDAIAQFNNVLSREDAWVENKISACLDLSTCYLKVNQEQKALHALYQSFNYDAPRAETCCALGSLYFSRTCLQSAAFWYVSALQEPNENNGGFVYLDCYKFLPAISLCVIFDKLNNRSEAIKYHEMAKQCKPNHPSVLFNETYFYSKPPTKELRK